MVAATDGSFDPHLRRAAGSWIWSTSDRKWSASGACPVDGELSSLASYRAELEALCALVYFLRRLRNSATEFTNEIRLILWTDNE